VELSEKTELRMLSELLNGVGTHTRHRGDIVRIAYNGDFNGKLTKVLYPVYILVNGQQAYLTEAHPIPYTADELTMVERNASGHKDTVNFLNDLIRKMQVQEIRIQLARANKMGQRGEL